MPKGKKLFKRIVAALRFWRPQDNSRPGASPAATKVFAIPDLLEAILLELTCKDVVLAQRVCAFWRATISDSDKLQKVLCFRSSLEPKSSFSVTSHHASFLYSKSVSARELYAAMQQEHSHVVSPILLEICPQRHRGQAHLVCKVDLKDLVKRFARGRNSALKRAFLTQPPAQEVTISYPGNIVAMVACGDDGCASYAIQGPIRAAEGVTVADFLEHVMSQIALDKKEEDWPRSRGRTEYYYGLSTATTTTHQFEEEDAEGWKVGIA